MKKTASASFYTSYAKGFSEALIRSAQRERVAQQEAKEDRMEKYGFSPLSLPESLSLDI